MKKSLAQGTATAAYQVYNLEQLEDHMLTTLYRTRLEDFKNGEQTMGADDQVFDLTVLPQQM